MTEHEFWRGERPERWRVMAEMEEDRARRYRAAMSETAPEQFPLGDRTIKGVRGSHAGRGPRNWRRPDGRILEEISDRLTDDPKLDASDLEVAVAVLEGDVGREDAQPGHPAAAADPRAQPRQGAQGRHRPIGWDPAWRTERPADVLVVHEMVGEQLGRRHEPGGSSRPSLTSIPCSPAVTW